MRELLRLALSLPRPSLSLPRPLSVVLLSLATAYSLKGSWDPGRIEVRCLGVKSSYSYNCQLLQPQLLRPMIL